MAMARGITKVEFREVTTWKGRRRNIEGRGWCFDIYFDRPYPNIISSAVKTNRGAIRNFIKYIKTGKLSSWGNAE